MTSTDSFLFAPLLAGKDKIPVKTQYSDIKEKKGSSGFADPEHNSYPIDTEKHVRAAISYFSKPSNYRRYPPEKRAKMWARIKKAAKKFGIEVSEPAKFEAHLVQDKLAGITALSNEGFQKLAQVQYEEIDSLADMKNLTDALNPTLKTEKKKNKKKDLNIDNDPSLPYNSHDTLTPEMKQKMKGQ